MGKRVSIAVCLTLGVSFALGVGCSSIPDSRKTLPAGYCPSRHSIPVFGLERGKTVPTTTKKDAKKAGKKLAAKSSTKAQKSAAASDLAQAARPGGSTSKKDAKKAGKKLGAKSSTKAQKSAAASALAQAKGPTGRKTTKKK